MPQKPPRKKVLIITYYWPPCGGIGVLRCLKIAKYLRDFGWEPVIFTAKDSHYPNLDYSNEKDIPEGITILRQKIWEPYALYKSFTGKDKDANVNNVLAVNEDNASWAHQLSIWIRSNFFIPDARAFWIKPSVKYLLQYLKENPIDAIFSDGPPHSNTRIATLLKQKTGIPWIADFQDPWTQVDYYKILKLTARSDRKHKQMEQEAFEAADKITIASYTAAEDLKTIGARNVESIVWGYDPEDFETLIPKVDPHFTFTHIGTMGYDRNPKIFFEVLEELKREIPEFYNLLNIQLIGQVGHVVKSYIDQSGVADKVSYVAAVSRKEALQAIADSTILLLPINQQSNAKGRIPGKLFEYLAVHRTILAFGPEDGDVAKIIRETNGGHTIEYENRNGMKKVLLKLYDQYQQGQLTNPLPTNVTQFSIKKLTGKIASFLNEITSN